MSLVAFLTYNFGISIPQMGIKAKGFGSAILTNVSGLGFKDATGSLCDFTRTIIVIVLCTPELVPVAVSKDKVEVRKKMTVNVTFDHRLCDGAIMIKAAQRMENVFLNPQKYF
jgi:pyruvate/2-oxoglutarate dehydrogenase complex dihydrolipoamide acyltransferase (E2) component